MGSLIEGGRSGTVAKTTRRLSSLPLLNKGSEGNERVPVSVANALKKLNTARGTLPTTFSPLVNPLANEVNPNTNLTYRLQQQIPSHAHYLIPYILEASEAHNIPAMMIASIIEQESSYREDIISGRTLSSAKAAGAMQIVPDTAKELGLTNKTVLDPKKNIMAGTRYYRQLLDRYGTHELALAAYNGGMGNLDRAGRNIAAMNLPETAKYVPEVMNRYRQWS